MACVMEWKCLLELRGRGGPFMMEIFERIGARERPVLWDLFGAVQCELGITSRLWGQRGMSARATRLVAFLDMPMDGSSSLPSPLAYVAAASSSRPLLQILLR